MTLFLIDLAVLIMNCNSGSEGLGANYEVNSPPLDDDGAVLVWPKSKQGFRST